MLNELSGKIAGLKVIVGVVGEAEKEVEFNETETASSCLSEHIDQGSKNYQANEYYCWLCKEIQFEDT